MIELAAAQAHSAGTPDQFFARWAEHSTWGEWSPDTEWVRLDAPAALGTTGTLKPKGGPKVNFTISAFEPGVEYTDTSKLVGARLVFQHVATATADGTALAARVTVDGPLARLWAKILGKDFAESVPADMQRLVALVEAQSA